MIINQASLDALRVDFKLSFDQGYSRTEPWYTKIASEIPSGARANVYGWIAQQLKMREWIGPRVAQNLSEHSYTLANKEFEGTVQVFRPDIRDDNLGIYSSQLMPQLGEAAKKHFDTLISALLVANPLAFDGLSMFNTAHLTYNGAGTYSNDFTTAPLNAANFNAAWAAMASYVGEDGLPLNVSPNLIVVPPQLKLAALQILQSTTIVAAGPGSTFGSVDNQLKGWAEVLVIEELASAPTVWYLLDTSKGIKPFIAQSREEPQFVSRDNPADPEVFNNNNLTYGVNCSRNVGVSLPFLATRNAA